MRQPDTGLFLVLARGAERHVGDFNLLGLANSAWAFANTRQLHVPLFRTLALAAT